MSHPLTRRRFLTLTAGSLAIAPFAGAFAREPGRLGGLIVHSETPMNAEPPLPVLTRNWQTPTEHFYIRSHAPVPKIDADEYRLMVTGLIDRELSLSLGQLAGYDQTSVIATMTCAGNRRYEHSKVSPIQGVQWREGAIGNAEWSGVRLSELLKQAGVQESAKHLWFEGLDEIDRDSGVIPFGASIPLEKAMDDTDTMPGALVCSGMNGRPLTPDHGWPVRTVIPGYVGARSVKWLGRIVVSDRPSPNHYVATAYKLVTEGSEIEWAEQGPIYRYPVNSVITTPTAGAKVPASGSVTISGYALPAGLPDVTIDRVRVSVDDGKTWTKAELAGESRPYCWQLWKSTVRMLPATTTIIVRARDSRGRWQPARVDWNLKGYLYNGWHRLPVQVTS